MYRSNLPIERRAFSYTTVPCPRGTVFLFLTAFLCFGAAGLTAQNAHSLRFRLSDHYTRVVREDLRVYEDGRYRGFLSREQRTYLHEIDSSLLSSNPLAAAFLSEGKFYRGNVYVIKEMSREAQRVVKPIDGSFETVFAVDIRGRSGFLERSAVPLRTNYPLLPDEAVRIGEGWEGEGVEYILNEAGELIEAPFRCRYTLTAVEAYSNRPAVMIRADYNYFDRDPYGPSKGPKVRGKMEADIVLYTDAEGGYFIRERVERYLLGGAVSQRKETGFRLVWSEGFSNRRLDAFEKRIASAGGTRRAEGSESSKGGASGGRGSGPEGGKDSTAGGGNNAGGDSDTGEEQEIEIRRTDEGVVLNLPNIHFIPDRAQILPDERGRLDSLAKMLKEVPEASFLVKGHTADVGSEESQIALSRERAKTIIDELVDRGLPPTKFIYRGLGGSEPAATNETEEGRAKNRRVEIVVLPK